MTRPLQLPPDVMRELARQVTEALVERSERLPGDRAWDGEFKQDLTVRLMEDPPETGRPPREVIDRAVRDILSVAMRLDHPRAFGFVPSAPTWPGVLADYLASGFNINAATWLTASGSSQLEAVVIDWFRRWLGYPETAGGILTSGGSASALDALVAAREAAGHPQRATVYMSDQSHSAQVRAARIIGVRRDHIRILPTGTKFRLDPASLAAAVASDRAAGCTPIAICADAGSSCTGAVDPLGEIADYCSAEGIWLHVDAAYGGFAAVTESGARLLRGIERADSVCLDPHKWFFQPYEAGCLLVRDVRTLERAFAIHHDVLQDSVWGVNHPNQADRGLQLSRRDRALKIWMSVQIFGMAAFRAAVAQGIELAERAERYIADSPLLELTTPASLGIVCFRINPGGAAVGEKDLDEINRNVLARMFWDDVAFLSSTSLCGQFAFRMCIINHTTTWDDVRATLEAIERFGRESLQASA
ncbi:MAG: aminotransferase class I/II-fold pyridoxal phosphate-dependent enzyme [Acidobacteria bacterium]|nr:aminotransferase class I/II-fold pyridoxal phosphate-dependent enzyme [Acidobacteriota bacterium]